jgi:bifunctional UDP-N-acetylglucosamine pyrophosphorylase/glucosamine-1-phosphate N-acetyltransferase
MSQCDPESTNLSTSTIIILAAGQGRRMKSDGPKAFEIVCGERIIDHQLRTICQTDIQQVIIVVSPQYRRDFSEIAKEYPQLVIKLAEQATPLGTGHAVQQALPLLSTQNAMVVLGDVPFIPVSVYENALLNLQTCHITTAIYENPDGLGRIIRDDKDKLLCIIEHKDCNSAQKTVREANTGIIAAKKDLLEKFLPKIQNNNQQQEYYLTDLISLFVNHEIEIQSNILTKSETWSVQGCNTIAELITVERQQQRARAESLIQSGVKIQDPNRFDCRGELICGKNVTIDINVIIEGQVIIGDHTTIGPSSILKNVTIGKNVNVKGFSHIESSRIEDHATIGPFAYCREQTHIHESAEIGCFVETKNTTLGKKSKAKHLSYIGNLTIGEQTNIGAGVIHCNYDGHTKHQSIIQNHVFLGANSSIIGPIHIENHATVAAGTTITKNVAKKSLAIARAKQVQINNWRPKQSRTQTTVEAPVTIEE